MMFNHSLFRYRLFYRFLRLLSFLFRLILFFRRAIAKTTLRPIVKLDFRSIGKFVLRSIGKFVLRPISKPALSFDFVTIFAFVSESWGLLFVLSVVMGIRPRISGDVRAGIFFLVGY